MNKRFEQFTDEELYMLKRQAIETSYEITCSDRYNQGEIDCAQNLLNEILNECRDRNL